jgi:hypothetical protein
MTGCNLNIIFVHGSKDKIPMGNKPVKAFKYHPEYGRLLGFLLDS